jgi:hypothetical protein
MNQLKLSAILIRPQFFSHEAYRLRATPPAQNLTEPLGLYTLAAFVPLADSDQRGDDADIVAAWLTRLGNPGVG